MLERCIPRWALPRVKFRPVRVVAINLVQLGIVLIAGATWRCLATNLDWYQIAVLADSLGGRLTQSAAGLRDFEGSECLQSGRSQLKLNDRFVSLWVAVLMAAYGPIEVPHIPS